MTTKSLLNNSMSHKNNQPNINLLQKLTKTRFEQMKAMQWQYLKTAPTEIITKISSPLISKSGKNIRAMITLCSAILFRAQTKKETNNHDISFATAVEMMHIATLLHDDVVDEAEKRRGISTANKRFGNQFSVLVGDYFLGYAFNTMVQTEENQALKVLAQAAQNISYGEIKQLSSIGNVDLKYQDYLEIIQLKTAELFAASAEIGAIVAKASDKQRNNMRNFGFSLGIMFQIQDDWLDYAGKVDATGKKIGADLLEAKITLPIILLLKKASPKEIKNLKEYFNSSFNLRYQELEEVCAILKKKQPKLYNNPNPQHHPSRQSSTFQDYFQKLLNETIELLEKYQVNLEIKEIINKFHQHARQELEQLSDDDKDNKLNKDALIAMKQTLNFSANRNH